MHSLNRLSAFFCLMLLFFLAPVMLPTTSQAMFSITIYFGTRHCEPGFGICRIDIGAREAAEAPKGGETARGARKAQASATVEQDKTARQIQHFLKIEMRSALPEKASVVPVAENIILDAATSKALGFKSVTVLRGEYKIDYSKNKLGSVAVNVEARN